MYIEKLAQSTGYTIATINGSEEASVQSSLEELSTMITAQHD